MRALVEDALLAQRGGLLCWVPVWLGLGIGWYFAQAQEPGDAGLAIGGAVAFALLLALPRIGVAYRPVVLAIIIAMIGAGIAKYRSEAVGAPVLNFRYYGTIEGRVVNIDRSASDALRLTLDRVVLDRIAPHRTPARVRVSVHGDQPLSDYRPGTVLMMTGHLSPPAGPAEPGGFDFQRHAWFLGLGAVGYTRNPVLRLAAPAAPDAMMRIFALRMAISRAVQEAMPGEAGAFAAALMTGDRSGMGQDGLAALRAANLAHLLAISGLHMGLLTGFVFAVVRYGLALLPAVALRLPTKKIAAVIALIVGAFYLALSGGSHVIAPPGAVLPILTLALLWLILWHGRARFAGLAFAALAFVIWQQGTRPALLVADDGALIGVLGPEGRSLSKPTGGSFSAGIWLENDGAPVAQDIAAARGGLQRDGRVVTAMLGDWRIVQVSGKTALAALQGCGGADVLIVNQVDEVARPCQVYDLKGLRGTGALAMDLTATGDLRIETSRARAGNRPWNGRTGPPEAALLLSRQ